MRTGSATARTTGRRTWLFCAAWLSIWLRWSPQKRRSRVSSSAPDGITPTWSPSSPKPQKGKCDSPAESATVITLRAKRDQIEGLIAHLEGRLKEARTDLAHV